MTISAQLATVSGQAAVIDLVGPKGYIHGWIFVGVPLNGDRVHHPHLGAGTVMGTGAGPGKSDNYVQVKFDHGGERKFEVRRVPGVPGFRPRTGPDPARAAVHDYAMKATRFTEDAIGAPSAWNGVVTLWPKEAHPGVAAYFHWNGDMSMSQDVAHDIARSTGPPEPGRENEVSYTYDLHVPLHELIHSLGPGDESASDSQWAYRYYPEVAALEEGFTELATAYHAEGFFGAEGLAGRETAFLRPGGGRKTLGELARERADPARIAKGESWGAYPEETAAALAWTREVARAEGLRNDLRSKAVQKRLRELSDEVNRASPRGKLEAMAGQMMRAMGVTDRPRSAISLSGEVALLIRHELQDSPGDTRRAARAVRDYLDSFATPQAQLAAEDAEGGDPEVTLTPEGERAYAILRWVQRDIPGRVTAGHKRLHPVIMAAAGDERARAEVSGVATYLMRYAGR